MTTEEKKSVVKNESARRGPNGEVGPRNMKGLYHSFQRSEGRKAKGVSLKSFAHKVAEDEKSTEEEREIALTWLKNKASNN